MNDENQPATKGDLRLLEHRLREFILDRESALTWRVIGLCFLVTATLCGGQLTVFIFMLSHWRR